jgi:hypothetical protein
MSLNQKQTQYLDSTTNVIPINITNLTDAARNEIIVTTVNVGGRWFARSLYGDDIWYLHGFTSNVGAKSRFLDFNRIAPNFRLVVKAMMYRYLTRGRSGSGKPRGVTLKKFFVCLNPFLKFLTSHNIKQLNEITSDLCHAYVAACREYKQTRRSPGLPLSPGGLWDRFSVVEGIYELSQYTNYPLREHPWPETSALALAGLTGSMACRAQVSKTRLMPDEIFCKLFQTANEMVERGGRLLEIRDNLFSILKTGRNSSSAQDANIKMKYFADIKYQGGRKAFNKAIKDLRTACYIVIASTSGCRNHELANLQTGSIHKSKDQNGNTYHWMRSRSEKTKTGIHDWMIPAAAVRALRIMERWAAPYQAEVAAEIASLKRNDPRNVEIYEASKHLNALFLGKDPVTGRVRTFTSNGWSGILRDFSKACALDWKLASHQFRRKFANYVAHSKFGDLRYLREHFAHWTLDMSLGYALDQGWAQYLDIDLETYISTELDDIKLITTDSWIKSEHLAGGFGKSITSWKKYPKNIAMFSTHSAMIKSISQSINIRSNGHAWCTADDDKCVGNSIHIARCGGCSNAVIGEQHINIYREQYRQLEELLVAPDIGESGRQRILQDMKKCADVLKDLQSSSR